MRKTALQHKLYPQMTQIFADFKAFRTYALYHFTKAIDTNFTNFHE